MTTNTNNTTTEAISWRDLIVSDSEGTWDNLGEIVRTAPANLDNAKIEDGEITSWDGFFLSAPGEQPDWDTPKVPVNWDGFAAAISAQCG